MKTGFIFVTDRNLALNHVSHFRDQGGENQIDHRRNYE